MFKQITDEIRFDHKDYPMQVGFHFVRDSKRKMDFHNMVHIIADLLVVHGVIDDDNMEYFIPYCVKEDGRWYTVDRLHPGVRIYF